jgi:signal transduction histidine kinase
MLRSVRWRLVLNSILISLAAIGAVGLVSLALVDAYFEQQETEYLLEQAEVFSPSITRALRHGNRDELRQVIAVAGLFNQVRIRIIDSNGTIIADSGERLPLAYFDEAMLKSPELFFALAFAQQGAFSEFNGPLLFGGNELNTLPPFISGSLLADSAETSLLTAISDTTLDIPLVRSGENVGYIEFSEGPAVGDGTRSSIRLALAGSSLIALLLAIMIGMWSARQVTRPLVALGTAADRMGSNDLSARAPGSKLREYDQLATQFNSMAVQLGGTIERLEQERTVLRRMIADASHELRTPLTALRTFNELLSEEVSAESDARTFVAESANQIAQLEKMTTGLLDLSRLEARLSGTNFVTLDVRRAVDQSVQALRPLADEKRQTLTVVLPPTAVALPHDPTALQQAISNLLHNAIKYTPYEGHINVALRTDESGISIAVRDDGPGISETDQAHIFDRFYRSPEHEAGGTGLGLSIVKEIANIHGGDVTFSSIVGQGSTFVIELPLQR